MRISSRQLKQLIKEAVEASLFEADPVRPTANGFSPAKPAVVQQPAVPVRNRSVGTPNPHAANAQDYPVTPEETAKAQQIGRQAETAATLRKLNLKQVYEDIQKSGATINQLIKDPNVSADLRQKLEQVKDWYGGKFYMTAIDPILKLIENELKNL